MILKRTAALVVVLSSMASSVSASGIHYRPKTSTVKGRSSGRKLQQTPPKPTEPAEKEERCKYLVPEPIGGKAGKGGKGGKGGDRTRARRRRAAVPNETFVQQEVETVYFDQAIAPPLPSPDAAPLIGKKGKAPDGFDWFYEDGDDGGEEPNPTYDYVECETPSSQPSSSSRPSTRPSKTPSVTPTAPPTMKPSATPSLSQKPSGSPSWNPSPFPTISHLPSVSLNPSLSSVPTQGPTMAYSPACDALTANETHAHTANTVEYKPSDPDGYYEYQMIYEKNVTLGELMNGVEEVLQSMLSEALIWCGNRQMRALSSRALMLAHNPEMVIDGIDLHGTKVNDEKECDPTVTSKKGTDQICKVFVGEFTTYLRKLDPNPTAPVVSTEVLEKIEAAMLNNALAGNVENADTIVYGGGAKATGEGGDTVGISAGERADPSANASISSLGGTILGLGVFMTLVFLFAATRKREHHKLKVVEQVFEDDETIFGMSNGSGKWKNQRGAHVLGEDDSVYSDFDGHDILADMKMAEKRHLYGTGSRGIRGPQEDNLGARGDALDVHNCTSATCQICTGRNRPIFVNSDMLSPIEEVSSSREEVSPITPSYANTIDMDRAERKYMSPDTVDM